MDGQQTHEKMLNIANYQRNINQNYNEVTPHTGQNGHYSKVTNNRSREGVQKRDSLTLMWEWKRIQPLKRIVWRFLN